MARWGRYNAPNGPSISSVDLDGRPGGRVAVTIAGDVGAGGHRRRVGGTSWYSVRHGVDIYRALQRRSAHMPKFASDADMLRHVAIGLIRQFWVAVIAPILAEHLVYQENRCQMTSTPPVVRRY